MFGAADSVPATVNETDVFAIGANRYKMTKTATGCTPGTNNVLFSQLNGNVVNVCIKGADQSNPNFFKGKHVLLSATVMAADPSELRGKTFASYEDCYADQYEITFNADGTAKDTESGLVSAQEVAGVFSPGGFSDPVYGETDSAKAFKVNINGEMRYVFVAFGKPINSSTSSWVGVFIQK